MTQQKKENTNQVGCGELKSSGLWMEEQKDLVGISKEKQWEFGNFH